MKILIPVLGFAQSGGYRVLSSLADAWLDQGHEVAFLSPQGEEGPAFPTRAPVLATSLSGEISQPGPALPHLRWRGARKLVALQRGLSQIGRGYDVVLANHSLTPYALMGTGIDRTSRFYYVQAYEPDYFRTEGQPGKWLLARLSYFLGTSQIANSPVYSVHAGVNPIGIVPAGLDLAIFHPKALPGSFAADGRIVLGCIGRREPVKGTAYVLSAFEELAATRPDIHLRVAYGNLPEGWSHPRAEVVVPRNDAELADYYRGIDILVAPGTVQHGAPHYPVMEAMACGTTVITTGYLPATPHNCWLVENRSSGAIAAAVQQISADVEGRLSRAQLALADAASYAWPDVADRMLQLFKAHA